jgi:hypothetical protein
MYTLNKSNKENEGMRCLTPELGELECQTLFKTLFKKSGVRHLPIKAKPTLRPLYTVCVNYDT